MADEEKISESEFDEENLRTFKLDRHDDMFEFPADEDPSTQDLMPWEIDEKGRPLKDKPRDRTPYEEWLEKKKIEDGVSEKCPQCGSMNVMMLFITGQKCTSCGFILDEHDSIVSKMDEHDAKAGNVGPQRFKDISIKGLAKSLAVPARLVNNPDSEFHNVYSSYGFVVFLAWCIVAFAGCIFIVGSAGMMAWSPIITLLVASLLTIFLVWELVMFVQSLRILTITVDQDGVLFSGMSGRVQMSYEKITSVSNERTLTGWGNFAKAIGWSPYGGSELDQAPTILLEDRATEQYFNDSSSSSMFANHITISSTTDSVKFTFSGGLDSQMIEALAVVIFMAKLRNKKCKVSNKAIRAAEKGHGHYTKWALRKGK